MLKEIQELYQQGLSQREIARKLDLGKSTVNRWLQKFQESALVINDLHFRFQDDKAIEVALATGELADVDKVILNGDVADGWQLSDFPKYPSLEDRGSVGKEIQAVRQFLKSLRKRFPDADIKYIFGNHEFRWDRFIAQHAKALYGLEGLSLAEQYHLDELGIELIYSGNKESEWRWGKLLIGHFDRVTKHSAYTAKLLLDDKGVSLIQAHTHRGGSHFRKLDDRILVAYENFCLCDLDPPYTNRPNWQQGFSIVWKSIASDLFHVEQFPIVQSKGKYQTMFGGEVVEA